MFLQEDLNMNPREDYQQKQEEEGEEEWKVLYSHYLSHWHFLEVMKKYLTRICTNLLSTEKYPVYVLHCCSHYVYITELFLLGSI